MSFVIVLSFLKPTLTQSQQLAVSPFITRLQSLDLRVCNQEKLISRRVEPTLCMSA